MDSKFFIPTDGPEDWKRLLADPEKHWRSGYSAKALAYSWEEAGDFPPQVKQVFSGCDFLKDAELLAAFPEYKVPLPGGKAPSQNDLFALGRSQGQLIAITVEGKVWEPFDKTVSEWLQGASRRSGKQCRLEYLCGLLEVDINSVQNIRYQLLHRTASALILAERFNASAALMLVHSFSQEHKWFEDYQQFLELFGQSGCPNSVTAVGSRGEVDTYLSWVVGDRRYLEV